MKKKVGFKLTKEKIQVKELEEEIVEVIKSMKINKSQEITKMITLIKNIEKDDTTEITTMNIETIEI